MSTVTSEKINDLRQRFLANQPWTKEELKDAIKSMLGDRLRETEAAAQPKATKRAPVTKIDLDDLLPR